MSQRYTESPPGASVYLSARGGPGVAGTWAGSLVLRVVVLFGDVHLDDVFQPRLFVRFYPPREESFGGRTLSWFGHATGEIVEECVQRRDELGAHERARS